MQGRVEFRLQEGKEKVEEVYCVCVWAQNVNMEQEALQKTTYSIL